MLVFSRKLVRSLAVVVLLAFALGGGAQQASSAPKPVLHVFLPHGAKARVLQEALQSKLATLEVVAFGRHRDLEKAAQIRPAEAVLAMSPALRYQGLEVTLHGIRDDKDWEPYSLVTLADQQGGLAGKTIGIVDILGRQGTKDFAISLVGKSDIKIKRVPKLDDLILLLSFSMADAVLMPSRAYPAQAQRTRRRLVVRELDSRVGLPALSTRDGPMSGSIVGALQALDPSTMSLLGLTAWRAP